MLHKFGYSPEIPVKKMASSSRTSNDGVVIVVVNPVAVLVALTVMVCCPPATPVYWKPDMPTRANHIWLCNEKCLNLRPVMLSCLHGIKGPLSS